MSDRLKISLVMPKKYPRIGGFENIVYELSRELSKNHAVQVIFTKISDDRPIPPKVVIFPLLKEIKIKYIGFFISNVFNMIIFLIYSWREKPDIINVHPAFPGGLIALLSSKLLKIPLIITSHGGDIQYDEEIDYGTRKSKMATYLLRLVLENCDAHILVSESMRNSALLSGSLDSKIKVIHNGIDPKTINIDLERSKNLLENELNIFPTDFVVLFLGRLIELKRPMDLLQGFQIADIKNGKLIFAGTGSEEEKLKHYVKEMKLEDKVSFAGFVTPETGKWDLINRCDVFALPSLSEGFSVSIIEAMACGKPVIGTKIGPIEEIIIPNEDGLLVNIESPQELAKSLKELYQNPKKRKEMGVNVQKKFKEKFEISVTADKYADVYNQLTKK